MLEYSDPRSKILNRVHLKFTTGRDVPFKNLAILFKN